jgi:hypothetical protein
VPNPATVRAPDANIVSRLARFFADASPVRIPIKLSRTRDLGGAGEDGGRNEAPEVLPDTVIEYGTAREVLFMVSRPLEFGDRIVIESTDGSLHAEASVVAVQYHPDRTAIAARFLKPVSNWIVKS